MRHHAAQLRDGVLRPPSRPPIRQVTLLYGVNLPTLMHSHFQQLGENITEAVNRTFEKAGGFYFSSQQHHRKLPFNNTLGCSGDGTVPYASLSWGRDWHFQHIAARLVPARVVEYYDHLLGQWGEREVLSVMNTVRWWLRESHLSGVEDIFLLWLLSSGSIHLVAFLALFKQPLIKPAPFTFVSASCLTLGVSCCTPG